MGFMPARASPSRPLVSVAFGFLPTPRRFAVPCGPPLNAPLFRAGLCAPRSRTRCMAFKPRRKEYHMSKTDNRPSHRVYAVTKNGERSFWQPIGAAWVHSDGWGQRAARLPPAQRRGDRHSQAKGRRGRRAGRGSRLILRGRLRAAPRTTNQRIRSGALRRTN
jgi:hypothetical protein